MANSLQERPSNLLAIEDEYVAFCFDEAVLTFGNDIEQQLENVKGKDEKQRKAQQEMLLNRILEGKSQFREPPTK